MEKTAQRLFFIPVGIILLGSLIFLLIGRYNIFLNYSDSGERIFLFILRGYIWQILFISLAIVALFKHTPNSYLLFMMHPFYLWTTLFLEQAYHLWLGMLLFGLIVPIIFNLKVIRKLYITDNRILIQKLCWAAGIGIIIGLSPLLRYWILN